MNRRRHRGRTRRGQTGRVPVNPPIPPVFTPGIPAAVYPAVFAPAILTEILPAFVLVIQAANPPAILVVYPQTVSLVNPPAIPPVHPPVNPSPNPTANPPSRRPVRGRGRRLGGSQGRGRGRGRERTTIAEQNLVDDNN